MALLYFNQLRSLHPLQLHSARTPAPSPKHRALLLILFFPLKIILLLLKLTFPDRFGWVDLGSLLTFSSHMSLSVLHRGLTKVARSAAVGMCALWLRSGWAELLGWCGFPSVLHHISSGQCLGWDAASKCREVWATRWTYHFCQPQCPKEVTINVANCHVSTN